MQRAILRFLDAQGFVFFRINNLPIPLVKNVGGIRRVTGFRPVRQKGLPDIVAVIPRGPSRGRLLAVEVKRPGAKARPEQRDVLDAITSAGGLAVVAHGVDELTAALHPLECLKEAS